MHATHSNTDAQISGDTRIGWIGTGVMGAAMCGHFIARGLDVAVHNRTRAKAQALIDAGASWCDAPASVAQSSDVTFTIVGYPDDVGEVYFGDSGVISGVRNGSVIVDMTTTQPSLAREIHARAQARGVGAVDAPVSGGDVGAKNGSLSIMVGGDRPVVDRIMPLLQVMGRSVVHQGGAGAGQHTKMCNQIVIATTMIGMCESLLYSHKAGLDAETMLSSIRGGAAGCWSLDHYAPRILKRDFDPGFFVDHFVKDMGIALQEAERMRLALPGLALAHQLYVALQAQGGGRKGTQALILALEQVSAIKRS